MQTLTKILVEQGLANRLLTDTQLARVIEGSDQRRYNLVNRAMKGGELYRLRRGLYLLPGKYRDYACHPYTVAQALVPGSYISLETALSYHGWIPEAVYTTASIVPGRKSSQLLNSAMGRFSFHPLAITTGYFLELVSRVVIDHQAVLVASPERALFDLVCLRKLEWQGLDWFVQGLRIERESLNSVTGKKLDTLKRVYKQKRLQLYLAQFAKALDIEPGGTQQ